jgi:transposase InsO family protein
MERVAIDYIERLTPYRWGNDMIIVIIDCFSRFVILCAVQSTKAKVFVDTFIKWISVFSEPKEVLSDQGSQFLSDIVQQLYDLTKIKCVVTTPNSKQENAIVERANREVMRHLRSIDYDNRFINEWSLHLPFAQRIMNSMIHSSTGVKPCQIVFGREFLKSSSVQQFSRWR